jgi:hypothetical protein
MHAFITGALQMLGPMAAMATGAAAMLLHVSLFLFFGGLGVFLSNTNHAVFNAVFWSVGYYSGFYALIVLMSLLLSFHLWSTFRESMSERLWKIDLSILRWLIEGLGDDDAQEKFFEAFPGFFNSKLVKHLKGGCPKDILNPFWNALNDFFCRTLSSNSPESVKSHRLDIGINAVGVIIRSRASSAPCDILVKGRDQVSPISETGLNQLLTHCTSNHEHISHYAQCMVTKILASVSERDDHWIQFATGAFGLSERDLRDHDDDSVSFSIFIHLFRQSIHYGFYDLDALMAFSKIDIRRTPPGLQHDFCTLWNEVAQEARNQGYYGVPVRVLQRIRHLYTDLHQGTAAAPTAFSASTDHHHRILRSPSSYPLCDIPSHRPDSTARRHITNSHAVPLLSQPGGSSYASPHPPSPGSRAVSQQAEQVNIIVGMPLTSNSTTTSEIGGTSHAPSAMPHTNPVHPSPRPTDLFPTGDMAAVIKYLNSATKLSHSTENNIQQDMGLAALTVGQISSTLPKPVPARASPSAPAPTSHTLILNKSLTTCDAVANSTSGSSLPALSAVGLSTPTTPQQNRVLPLLNGKSLALLGSTASPSLPTGNVTLPRLRARGLVNTGSMCFVNAVLQLLVHSPPFWNMFRELGDLEGQREVRSSETGGGATPLVDATVRFSKEFVLTEKEPPLLQRPPEQAAGGKPKEDEEAKKEDDAGISFEPTYMYDAMKEKRQLKNLLVRSRSLRGALLFLICAGIMFIGRPSA